MGLEEYDFVSCQAGLIGGGGGIILSIVHSNSPIFGGHNFRAIHLESLLTTATLLNRVSVGTIDENSPVSFH